MSGSYGLLATGTDYRLYTIESPSTVGQTKAANTGLYKAVTVMNDGTILTIGTNDRLYTLETIDSDPIQAANAGLYIAVTAMPDGTLVAIGTDYRLYTIESPSTVGQAKAANAGLYTAITPS